MVYMQKKIQPLTSPQQVRDSIAYFATRKQTFQQKADAEQVQLRDSVVAAVTVHGISELEASKLAGVTRETVRRWLGK